MDSTDKIKKKRYRKKKINKQRARLIIRNLDFSTTEENLREHFERFGDVDDVKVLKKDDGQLTGCGFVQFKLVQKAAKARHYLNGTKFLDRIINCDWAVAKDKYVKHKEVEVEIKKEPMEAEDVEIKEEVKVENEDQDNTEGISGKDSDDSDSDIESVDNNSHDEEDDMSNEEEDEKQQPNPKHFSHDLVEGKTIFIKNAPFTATNEDIKQCFSKFGPLYYALVCMDHLTEHSKGSAFIKFVNKEDADKCLATKDIILMGHTLECQAALSKEELSRSHDQNSNKNMKSDSRNLYLVKEGVVYAGSKAADNVSASDMGKRLQLEKYKTQMLKNLSMCVAKTRLVVHNIPPGWNDSKLKLLFQKFAGPNAVIKEARIMKNMRGNAQSFGQSKEFGFVTFTTHEAALQALRSINNNPNIFSANKRPIVAFSIEDRSKLRAKEKRLINSKLKNPNYKEKPELKSKTKKNKKQQKMTNNEDVKTSNGTEDVDERPAYSGTKGKPGETKLRGNFKLRVQALVHREQLKKQRRKNSIAKKALKEVVRQEKQENKKKAMFDDSFSTTVQNYKKMLVNSNVDRKKWYE